jgi:phosphotransferase system  glucose/maltose/N-acetylglucosamine-specific IIC component
MREQEPRHAEANGASGSFVVGEPIEFGFVLPNEQLLLTVVLHSECTRIWLGNALNRRGTTMFAQVPKTLLFTRAMMSAPSIGVHQICEWHADVVTTLGARTVPS